MKTFKYFLCIAVLAFASMTAFAQESVEYENGNRDENGKVVRGPYLTNGFWDNWFIGAELGINTFTDRKAGYKPMLSFPSLDINVGKWLAPQYGLRLGYQGWAGKEDSSEATQKPAPCTETFKYAYVHGDFLWNISNEFGGYKETRFWNFVPYVHAGYLRLYDAYDEGSLDGHKYGKRSPNPYDNELAAGVGLLNVLRISNRLNATIDLRHMVFSGRFHNWFDGSRAHNYSAMVGLQVNLGKTNWRRAKPDACCDSYAAAKAALADAYAVQDKLKADLAAANAALAAVPAPAPEKKDYVTVEYALGVPPLTIFFDLNSTELNYTERQHLDFYVTNVIEKDPARVFYLTGSADKFTGNDDINNRLSRSRVENVIKVLKEEYNISSDRLVLKGAVISGDHPEDPRLDRSVIIEH